MITIRHIERLFSEHQHRRLYRELISGRPEATCNMDAVLARPIPLAALGIIRLDELSQSHNAIYRRLLNVVLTSQQPDGSWGDPMTTALCIRALLCGGGQGDAVERGLTYLANLQKPEGVWPKDILRRMPADAMTSAFVLMQLGEREAFRNAIRFDDALDWFTVNAAATDPDTRRLWNHAAVRCRAHANRNVSPLFLTSRAA